MGAAFLAGLKINYWKDIEDIRKNKEIDAKFSPSMDEKKRIELLDGWNASVKMLLK